MNYRRIIRASSGILLLALAMLSPLRAVAEASPESPLRLAVIGLTGDSAKVFDATLSAALAKDARVTLLDPSLIRPAVQGVGYQGSTNLSLDEAKDIGAAIGCDFFIIGKTATFRRSERAGESHEERFAGVLIVDGRAGKLAHFDFILQKAASREAAQVSAAREVELRASRYVEKMLQFRADRELAHAASAEAAEDLPDADSAQAKGFKPPDFLNRVKPEYTEAADCADLKATIEARVVFRASGEIGDIEILRWAGFGLEESARHAIKQLKFNPATRNGQPISVRALVQYNFRRLSEAEVNKKPSGTEP